MLQEVLKTYTLSRESKNGLSISKINITVRKGDIYALLGRSDSGTATIVRMLAGLLRPTSGSIELFGNEAGFAEYRHLHRVGAALAEPGLYTNLTVEETLDMHSRLMNVPDRSGMDRTLERLGIKECKRHLVRDLSPATRQKVSLARALMHNPELLILEDPTSGLDPAGICDIRQLIMDLAQYQQVTVILSSNLLSEVEQIATRIGVVSKGCLVDEIDPSEFSKSNRSYVEFKVNDIKKASFILEQKMSLLDYKVFQNDWIRLYSGVENAAGINRTLVQEGIDVMEFRCIKRTLEDHFLALTGG